MEYEKRFSSFYLRRSASTIILMLHGFTGSPLYFQAFGRRFAERGISVFAKQLAGHGTTPGALAETTFEDWRSSALDTLLWLSDRYEEIYVVGHSLGGALAIDLAGRFPGRVRGVVAVGAPYALRHHLLHRSLLPFIGRVKKFHQKKGISVRNYFQTTGCYESFPLPALKELYAYINRVFRPRLHRCVDPLLVIQPGQDDLVQRQSGEGIIAHVGSVKKQYVLDPLMPHNPFLFSRASEFIFDQTWNFFAQTSNHISSQAELSAPASTEPLFSPDLMTKKVAL